MCILIRLTSITQRNKNRGAHISEINSMRSVSRCIRHDVLTLLLVSTLHVLCKSTQTTLSDIWGNFSASPTWSTKPTNGCGARSTSLRAHRNLFWQLSREISLHGLGHKPHATTASPKSSFGAPRRAGDTVVVRGNAGWTTQRSGNPCACLNFSRCLPAEMTGRGSMLNHPYLSILIYPESSTADNRIGQKVEIN